MKKRGRYSRAFKIETVRVLNEGKNAVRGRKSGWHLFRVPIISKTSKPFFSKFTCLHDRHLSRLYNLASFKQRITYCLPKSTFFF